MKQRTPSSFTAPLDRPAWLRYGFAAVLLLAAQGARWLIDPYTSDAMPLATMFIAVAWTVCFAGWKPAAVLAITGYIIGVSLFVSPRFTFKVLGELVLVRHGVIIAAQEGAQRGSRDRPLTNFPVKGTIGACETSR